MSAGEAVAGLLAECPRLTVLATSREPIHLQAEHEYLLSPLQLPTQPELSDETSTSEAVRLFVDRARATRHDFSLTADNARAVARVCIRLDGLPLAIELAAGRIRFLPPEKLLSLLESQGSGQLSVGSKDMPSRHRTLKAAIEWSHDLLTPAERELFRRLAVFRGGLSLEGVERTCQIIEGENVLALFESLVEKNLVHLAAGKGEPWYVMLETIREFAEQRLEESGEADALRLRHARYYVDMAEKAELQLDRSNGAEWATRLEREYRNLRFATEWAATHELEIALRIAAALTRFISIRMLWLEQRDLLSRLLSISRTTSTPGLEQCRAKLLSSSCTQSLAPWSAQQSVAAAEECVSLCRKIGDKRGLGNGLLLLGLSRAYDARDPSTVLALLRESSALQRETGDQMGLSNTTFFQALFTHISGDSERSRTIAEECLEVARRAGDVVRFAAAFSLIGLIETDGGNYEGAQSWWKRAFASTARPRTRSGFASRCPALGGSLCFGEIPPSLLRRMPRRLS